MLFIDKDLAKSLDELSEIRRLVNSLYSALNANEEKVREEKMIADKLDEIQAQLEPLEKVKIVKMLCTIYGFNCFLTKKSHRYCNLRSFLGKKKVSRKI